jgi:hypothetical protein
MRCPSISLALEIDGLKSGNRGFGGIIRAFLSGSRGFKRPVEGKSRVTLKGVQVMSHAPRPFRPIFRTIVKESLFSGLTFG